VATTTNVCDTILVDFCKNRKIFCHRGSEQDVLARFIDTAEQFKLSHIIRVCSDNPFLYSGGIKKLGETLIKYPNLDYISFKIGEIPSILTHYGFWAELVSLNALYVANKHSNEQYHEHVTNYIYTNSTQFNIEWLEVSEIVKKNKTVRLTVDDSSDFFNAQAIYNIVGEKFSPESIIKIINNNYNIKQNMLTQIVKNQK
jgi:spore coat polysaccharide biosynthesis protein SpsF